MSLFALYTHSFYVYISFIMTYENSISTFIDDSLLLAVGYFTYN